MDGCWSFLKGGIVANFSSGPADILFKSNNTDLEIWVDSVSLQPFTMEQWRSHQDQSIDKASHLEQVLREGHSHPGVKGIIMWALPAAAGSADTTLADINFKNTPSGDVVDKLFNEWKFKTTEIKADSEGSFEVSLFHGDYDITIKDPFTNSSTYFNYKLTEHETRDTLQKVQLEEGKLYSFSAWVQVKNESEDVAVVFRRANGELIRGGRVTAMDGCWSFLKAGIVANFSSGPADILFECLITTFYNGGMDIPPRPKYSEGKKEKFTLPNISPQQSHGGTESVQGRENYAVADAMVKFAQVHGIRIRGHNIFWDDPRYQPSWEKNLSPNQLRVSAQKRINFVVSRFYEDKLGKDASAMYIAHQLDPGTRLFMNEYNTIEESGDRVANPANYIRKLKGASLDTLASLGLPIWLTEVDVASSPNQAKYLDSGASTKGKPLSSCRERDYHLARTSSSSGWKFQTTEIKADSEGSFEVSLFYGDYDITVEDPLTNSSTYLNYKLTEHDTRDTVHIHINA
ncbi:hypothetical protein JCGZ_16337 [Jatropha curcas]|uniref:GH10 domain-containing protein n=1 Tax=Jatropha curcas TaxID=180498 RepID=A0A067LJN2_JATCU|nr:hypothetical protein JCGZ_16337 [Jatropha curcas]